MNHFLPKEVIIATKLMLAKIRLNQQISENNNNEVSDNAIIWNIECAVILNEYFFLIQKLIQTMKREKLHVVKI